MRKLVMISLAVVMLLSMFVVGGGCQSGDKEITVGNKNFTEQYIVGEMMRQLLEDRGFTVELATDLTTELLRGGMAAGDIDICAEYTGTAWTVHLAHIYTPGVDNNELYDLVKAEEADNGFAWLDPIWNNNTYILVSWADFAADNNLTSLSDLAALYNAGEVEITTFVGFEFSTRPDGLPALEEHYGFSIPEASLMTASVGTTLLGLENHECDIAMGFGTDAIITEYDWHVYQDDLAFFPPYDLVPYVSQAILDEYPEIEDILNELTATFPGGGEAATPALVAQGQTVWQGLVAKVDLELMEPEEVAYEYLVDNGLIDG